MLNALTYRKIEGEKENLLRISKTTKAKQYLDFDEFKKDIETIIYRMKASTEQLKVRRPLFSATYYAYAHLASTVCSDT